MVKDPTCEERIGAHLESRLADFRALTDLAGAYDQETLTAALETPATREMYEEIKSDEFEEIGSNFDDLNESARTAIWELPLGVSSYRVFRVDLSTGGPGDWLEVTCSGDTRITYHFNDWFDHAERELHGDEYDTALAFVGEVVPELVD